MTSEKARLPLDGIRVLDFTWVAAGPFTTLMLANMGAEVIKVESARRLDLSRGRPPFPPGKSGINASAAWIFGNVDKLSITLNMAQPKGRQIARRLVAISDIVMDNMTGGVMERWGMNYEELVRIKPDIIAVSMPVMGTTGPRRDYGGYGMGIEGISGIKAISGPPDQIPLGTGIAFPDAGPNPRHAVVGLLAALHYRNKTGKGQYVEVAQYESTAAFSGTAILEYTTNKRLQPRLGNRLPYAAPHGAYRCKGDDRWCVIAIFSDEEWEAFCHVIGDPPWSKEERFATILGRKKNEDELDRLVEEWTMEREAEEVMMSLQQAGVAAGIIQSGQNLLEHDPHLKARKAFVEVDNPEAGVITCHAPAFRLSSVPERTPRYAPLFGEHNQYVFQELLGMSEEEMDQLIVEEVIY